MPLGGGRRNRRLVLSVAAFVLLDLGTLAFNFQIARQVEHDALAINLAGRQRMLSQRMTKAALMATLAEPGSAQHLAASREAIDSWTLFRRTLDAFADGGITLSSRGESVALNPVTGEAIGMVQHARQLLPPMQSLLPEDLPALARFTRDNNGQLLKLMNDLTSELETQSVRAVFRLRIAQTMAFLLSLVNFFLILLEMQRTRQRAEREAMTDALTGLHNRAGLYEGLEHAVHRHNEQGNELGVILLDLDGFKGVNDTYGHAAGDEALIEAARRILQWSRPGWICGRLGGDEFAIICRGATVQQLADAAVELNDSLADIRVGQQVVSASVGHASASGIEDCTADKLMHAADVAMFALKAGKHRSRIRGGPIPGELP